MQSALRSKLSRRQRQTTYAATQHGDDRGDHLPSRHGQRRVRQRSRVTSAPGSCVAAALGSGAIGEQAEAGGARAADRGAERAGGAQGVERARRDPGAARAPRLRGRSRARRTARPGCAPLSARSGSGSSCVAARRRGDRTRRRPRRWRARPRRESARRASGRQARPARRARPRPARARAAGRAGSGTSEPSSGGELAAAPRGSAGRPASSLAIRSAAAASALPPPSPAATGHPLPDRDARAAAARRPRASGTRPAPRAARLSPDTPSQSTVSSPDSFGSAITSSARSIEAISEQTGCMPSSRGRPTCRTRLSLA